MSLNTPIAPPTITQRARKASLTLALSLLAVPTFAQTPQTLGCLIEPQDTADLGTSVVGIVEQINADRGDRVSKGQVLAVLRSDVERAATQVARSRSAANAELQAALSNQTFAEQKFRRTQDLVARNFLSQHALDEASNDLKIAAQRVAQAREQLKVWGQELGLAEAQLSLRELKSPFDGVITERYLSLGERMEEKPIFRIAQIDPLRVEAIVPARLFGTIEPGNKASIKPDLASIPTQSATVTQIDRVIDAASNTFRVRLSLPNPDHRIPAGLRCKIEFATTTADSSAAPSAANAITSRP